MSNTHPVVRAYGSPASQPCRAVFWTCLMGGIPFEVKTVGMDAVGAEGPLAGMNPRGQVPTIEDDHITLYEMPAILTYLCEQYEIDDLLPKDTCERAKVNQYLHMHHSVTRQATMHFMAPFVGIPFTDPSRTDELSLRVLDPDKLEHGLTALGLIAGAIERGYLNDGSSYLCGDRATIADIACYEELSQLCFANLCDLTDYPSIRSWMSLMEDLPFHEQVHRYNTTLGDIRTQTNTAERFVGAIMEGLAALSECGVSVSPL